MSYPILFDGHDLESMFLVEWHIDRELTTWQPDIVEAPAAIGSLWGGTQAQPVNVGMELTVLDKSRDGRQEALRTLAGWLAVDSPRVLQLADEGGRFRMAAPTGNANVSALLDADTVQISFICPDPRLYGETHTHSFTTSTVVLNGGTAPSHPSFVVSNAAGGSDGYLTITDQTTGEYMAVPLASGASSTVSIDCASRVLTIDGDVTMLGPTSDWLRIGGGETHTIALTDGSGTVDMALTEMWW